MKKILILFIVLLFGVVGCDDDESNGEINNWNNWGTEGNSCYPNSTCNESLICENDICVTEDATAQPGEEGGPCLAGDECNEGLICEDDICVTDDATPQPGEEGGPCLAGDECNQGLECVEDICIVDTTPDSGEEGGPCLADDRCNFGLLCHENECVMDADNDGYPASLDCDDNNHYVFPGYVEVCNSQCNWGIRSCMLSGQWSQCTADTDCACAAPGDTREVDCGFCGTTTQHCNTDFEWELPTQCSGGGECFPGMEQKEHCGFCGTITRTCVQDCTWPEFTTQCENPGECLPGYPIYTTEGCGDTGAMQEMNCNNLCELEPVTDTTCISEVPIPARENTTDTSGNLDYKAEVCIPAEQVYSTMDQNNVATISPFCIDIYEVTNARYQECVDAGSCQAVTWDATEWNLPVTNVTWYDAMNFCRWDGGRTLPTRAEWLLAAKGPIPNNPTYTWGETEPSSELVVLDNYYENKQPVDYIVAGVSDYGIYSLLGNASEWGIDQYVDDFYVTGLNPFIENNPIERSWCGGNYKYISSYELESDPYMHAARGIAEQRDYLGFRCVRCFIHNLNPQSK